MDIAVSEGLSIFIRLLIFLWIISYILSDGKPKCINFFGVKSMKQFPFDFKDKTALLTGATGHLGISLAKALINEGINVVLQYNNSKKKADDLLISAQKSGIKAAAVKADLEDPGSPAQLIEEALKLTGNIDYLINSASIYRNTDIDNISAEDILKAVSINAAAPFLLSREFRNLCKSGSVVNILDARMVDYDRNHIAYSLSKQMLFSLTRITSAEFAPEIRVNAIAPGIITIPEGTDSSLVSKMKDATLLNKTGNEEDIVSTLFYLLSNSFVTGETIFVDGGRNLRGRMFGL